MSEQTRSTTSRRYQKSKRALDEQATRARIVDAAVHLHGTVGPARTTLAAVARTAGVTRATLYRHFADDETLFLACSGEWRSRQRLPAPEAWKAHPDGLARLRTGLTDIYAYYREAESMLRLVLRDRDVIPERLVEARLAAEREWRATLLAPFPHRRKTLRATISHATDFTTWDSLCIGGELSDRAAVELMVGLARVATR